MTIRNVCHDNFTDLKVESHGMNGEVSMEEIEKVNIERTGKRRWNEYKVTIECFLSEHSERIMDTGRMNLAHDIVTVTTGDSMS